MPPHRFCSHSVPLARATSGHAAGRAGVYTQSAKLPAVQALPSSFNAHPPPPRIGGSHAAPATEQYQGT